MKWGGCLVIGLILSCYSVAATKSWKGTTSNSWTTPANWVGGVPATGDDVIIGDANFTGPNQPSMTLTSITLNSLTLGGTVNATLTCTGFFLGGNTLTINNTLTIFSGSSLLLDNAYMQLAGSFTTAGTGLLKTLCTNTAPIPSGKTWTMEVEYGGASQSVESGTYTNLTFSGTGTKTLAASITATGNCTLNASTLNIANSSTVTLTVGGDFTQNGGYVDFNSGTSGQGTLALKGNLKQAASFMGTSGNVANGLISFIGSGSIANPQVMDIQPNTSNSTTSLVNPGTGLQFVNVTVSSGTVVKLNSNVQLNSALSNYGVFTVNGTLNVQDKVISANTAGSRADFILNSGATLLTSNTAGINSTGSAGSIQTTATSASRSFSSGANYEFDGTAAGSTGVFTLSTPNVVNNLTINTTNTVTAAQAFTVNGVLSITGTLDMTTLALSGGTSFSTSGNGILKTQNTTSTPIPPGKIWTNEVQYNAATSAQTVVTGTYGGLGMSGTGTKTFAAGTVNVTGNWSSAGGTVDLNTNAVNLNFTGSSAQTLTDAGSGTGGSGVYFKTVGFSGGGTKTLAGSGKFAVASTGTLTMAANTVLAANGYLTLKSDINATAAVSAIPTGSSITGDVYAERFMYGNNSNSRRGYRLLSSVTHDANTSTYNVFNLKQNIYITGANGSVASTANDPTTFDYSPNQGASIYHYNEAIAGPQSSADFTPITLPLTNDEFKVGEGMYVFYRGLRTATDASGTSRFSTTVKPEDNTLVYKGTLNQGSYSPAITYTNYGTAWDGYNLVGNPYPSTIDLLGGGITFGSGLSNFVWLLDPTTKAYATFNRSNMATTGNASQYIASGEGFFVQAISGTGATITFTENAKLTTKQLTAGSSLLMSVGGLPAATKPQWLKLKMINPTDSTAADDILISFESTGKDAFDKNEDGVDFGGNGTTFLSSFSADNVKLAINTMPAINKSTRIKLLVNSTLSGTFNLQAGNLSSLNSQFEPMLVDNLKNDTTRLLKKDTYTFNIDRATPATYDDNRFQIIFKARTPLANPLASFYANQVRTHIDISWQLGNDPVNVTFTVEKSLDKKLFTTLTQVAFDGKMSYSFTDNSPAAGDNYYRLKQTDAYGQVTYSAIIDVKYAAPLASVAEKPFKIFPQPVVSTLNVSLYQIYKGNIDVRLVDLFGQEYRKTNFTGTSFSLDVSKLKVGSYVIELTNADQVIGRSVFIKL